MGQHNQRNLIRKATKLEDFLDVPPWERQDLTNMNNDDLDEYVAYLQKSDCGALYSPIEI